MFILKYMYNLVLIFLCLDYFTLEREIYVYYILLTSFINPPKRKLKKPPGKNYNDRIELSLRKLILSVPEDSVLFPNTFRIYPSYYYIHPWFQTRNLKFYFGCSYTRVYQIIRRWYKRNENNFKFVRMKGYKKH